MQSDANEAIEHNENRTFLPVFLNDQALQWTPLKGLYQILEKTISPKDHLSERLSFPKSICSFQMRIDKQIGASTAHFDTFEI